MNLKEFQKKISYQFHREALLQTALTHTSYANEFREAHVHHNERLEFLGDAVLELVSSEFLYSADGNMKEGEMSKKRAAMVCEPSLAYCARQIGLGDYLLLGKGEEASGGKQRDSITSDAMEALIGAIYLDGGFTSAKEFIQNYILKYTTQTQFFYDSKTILQELSQERFGAEPQYVLVGESGPDHLKEFSVQVSILGTVYGKGIGKTKKAAQQHAAQEAVMLLKKEDNHTCI